MSKNETTRLFLIRHAETEANSRHLYQGLTDHPLNENGLWQARRLAERFSREPLRAVYASTLKRAAQTAEMIAGYHDIRVQNLDSLKEIDFGEWEGLTAEEISERHPELFQKWVSGDFDIQIPGGEKRDFFLTRIRQAISQIVGHHQGEAVVVVSHGGLVKSVLCDALATRPMGFWYFRLDNASVNLIEYNRERHVVIFVNDTCHLRSENESRDNS